MESLCNLRYSVRLFRLLTFSKPTSFVRNLSGTDNISSSTSGSVDSQATKSDSEKKMSGEMKSGEDDQMKYMKEKNDELLDKYKRALADGENMRQRLTKQIQDAKIFGIQSFCKDLLEVADNLGQATKAVPKEEINSDNPHLKNLYDGLVLTKNSLEQVFKRHGLETIEPLKAKFNPNLHEALFQKECKDVEPGTVVEVTKIGYKLHNRCIRPALVGVSKN